MADIITVGQKDTLTAVYTWSDGTTTPADDAAWALDNAAVAALSAAAGAVVDETPIDLVDGSLTPTTVTVSGGGFTATIEVDVQASAAPVVTGIAVMSSGPEPA